MSMPFLSFSCSRCEYSASDLFFGLYSYEGPSGPISLGWALGWCNECAKIAPFEIMPSAQKIDELKSKINELQLKIAKEKQRVAQCRDQLMQNRLWIKKLLKISVKPPPSEIFELNWKCQSHSRKIKDEQQRLKLLASRKSAPRCLKCGATDCFLLPKLPSLPQPKYPLFSTEAPSQAEEIGMKHPGCGGDLLVEWADVWVNMKSNHRIYDIEGSFLRSENNRFEN